MTALVIETERLILALPESSRAAAALDFHVRSWPHLMRWFPPVPPEFDQLYYWHEVVTKSVDAFNQDSAIRLWISPKSSPDKVIGTIGFSQIFRGPFCNCVLGYQLDHAYEGRGLMHESLRAAIRYTFTEQKLHRINANYRPENTRSGRLLAKLGFHIDGFSKKYLFVDGDWRDHILTSLVNDQFRPEWLKTK
ncbi:MAG: GNAT family N-acetyltransferase [Pseudomonadota bacterium]